MTFVPAFSVVRTLPEADAVARSGVAAMLCRSWPDAPPGFPTESFDEYTQPVMPSTVTWVRSPDTVSALTVVPLRSVAWIVADDTDGVMFVVVARYIVDAGGASFLTVM